MRLTLRTLLAYLDDILEPSQAKEIGSKVGESSMASSLVSRIREVMRRRRLTAPTLSGPGAGIDANTVAEYLDNTLAPDGVADVEKVCLESDVHLAEVAACHQILTLALGEPVDVPSKTRERMYALGPFASRMTVAGPGSVATTDELPSEALKDVLSQAEKLGGNGLPKRGQIAAAAESFQATLPEYLRPQSSWKKTLGIAAALVVAALWGVFAFQQSPLRKDRDVADSQPVRDTSAEEAADETAPATDLAVPRQAESKIAAIVPERPAATTRNTSNEAPALDLPIEVEDPADAEAVFRREPDKTPPATVVEATVPPVEEPVAPVPAAAAKPAPVILAAPPVRYASQDGIALHYVRTEENWFVLPRRAFVHPADLLVVPEPFEGSFELQDGSAAFTLSGRTSVQWLSPTEFAPLNVELRRGRFVVRTSSANDQAPPLKLGIVLGDATWKFEIESGTICGIDLVPREVSKFEQPPAKSDISGGIFVSSGGAAVTDPEGSTTYLHAPVWLKLPAAAHATADKLLAIPQWLNRQSLGGVWEQLARQFEKRFPIDGAIGLSLPAVAEDPNPLLSKLATDCLGLIEAYRPLIGVLQRTNHDEARRAAISGLRQWLPRDDGNRELLKAELAKLYTPDDAQVVYRLLWGFDADDLRDKTTSLQILDWMEHPEKSIRELAFYDVYRLTQKTHEYRASQKPLRIQSAVNTWRQHIAKEGGFLPALPKDPNE